MKSNYGQHLSIFEEGQNHKGVLVLSRIPCARSPQREENKLEFTITLVVSHFDLHMSWLQLHCALDQDKNKHTTQDFYFTFSTTTFVSPPFLHLTSVLFFLFLLFIFLSTTQHAHPLSVTHHLIALLISFIPSIGSEFQRHLYIVSIYIYTKGAL